MKKLLWLLMLAVTPAFAQVPVIGSTVTATTSIDAGTTISAGSTVNAGANVNATTGYTIGGAAPSNEILCGNGTDAVFATSCGTFFYQTVEVNGTPLTQRPAINFSSFFSVGDSASPARTEVDAAQVGANAICTNPSSVIVDAYGRTTACSSGTNQMESFSVSGCTTPSSTDGDCQGTITLPVAMADTNYTPTLTTAPTAFVPGATAGPFLAIEVTGALTTTTIPYNITCTFGCSGSTATNIYVIVRHN